MHFEVLSYCRLLPESIPWLAANNQVDKAEKILRQAAAMNKVEFPDEILQGLVLGTLLYP